MIAQHRFLGLHKVFARDLLVAQDKERAWVAREVHDDAVQRLAALGMELSLLEAEPLEGAAGRKRVRALQEEVRDLSTALRELAHRLHPSALEHGDVHAAVDQLVEETQRVFGLRVTTDLPPMRTLKDPELVRAVYRIAQEALRNAATHAEVAEVMLSLELEGGSLVLTVRDRGRGFDQSSTSRRNGPAGDGIGLLAIRERAILAGGSASVTSRPGAGTTIRAVLPARELADG